MSPATQRSQVPFGVTLPRGYKSVYSDTLVAGNVSFAGRSCRSPSATGPSSAAETVCRLNKGR